MADIGLAHGETSKLLGSRTLHDVGLSDHQGRAMFRPLLIKRNLNDPTLHFGLFEFATPRIIRMHIPMHIT